MGALGRVRGVGGVIVLLAVTVSGCASGSRRVSAGVHGASSPSPPPATTTSSTATIVTRFTPYSAAGALTVAVQSQASGYCWTNSITVALSGAYRCLVGNDIADPCFVPPQPSTPATVACLADPWSGARMVTLTHALPSTDPIGNAANPWAVQLANGARCVAVTGTVQRVDGVSLNLQCAGGALAGGLDRTGRKWRVKYGRATGAGLTLVDVVAAWRG